MRINFEEIERETGRKFENVEQLYFYISYSLDYLRGNNKNYNKKQFEKIDELFHFFHSIEF